MKFLKLFVATTICVAVIFSACKKPDVYTDRQSYGSLIDSLGECLPKNVEGIYKEVTPLAVDNFIDVHVIVDSVGAYEIKTDSINGYSFKGTGTFGIKGDNLVRLYGHGSPDHPGTDIFTVSYGSTSCSIAVKVLAAPHADFILDTTAGGCPGAKVEGTLSTRIAATSANKAKLAVVVTKLGVYNITIAPQYGISYQAKGVFTTLGAQTIDFIASGTPIASGDFNYEAKVNGTSCIFSVNVVEGPIVVVPPTPTTAVFTLGGSPSACTGFVLGGTYKVGTALTSSNTVKCDVNVTTVGSYSITTNTENGMSFSASGTFASTGTQTVTLTGTGTPAVSGSRNFTATGGSTNCTFSITAAPGSVTPPPTGDCKACSYVPWCDGTNYTNISTRSGTSQTLVSNLSIVKDTVIDGLVFKKTETGSGPATYYNCNGGVSTIVAYNITTVSGAITVTKIVQTLLKANEPVGATWTNTLPLPSPDPSISQTAIYDWTIGDKGISKTVQGVTYNDVIRVHMVLSSRLSMSGVPDQTIVSSESDYYYAKGVGLIEQITVNSFTGSTDLHQELKSYFIP